MVELFRVPKPKTEQVFDTPWSTWDELRELGQAFGWIPEGTTTLYERTPEKEQEAQIRRQENMAELAILESKESVVEGERFRINILRMCLDPYSPVDWCYGGADIPVVSASDASSWADALNRALKAMEAVDVDLPHRGPYIITEGTTLEQHNALNGGLSRDYLGKVISFMQGGAFGVGAWD